MSTDNKNAGSSPPSADPKSSFPGSGSGGHTDANREERPSRQHHPPNRQGGNSRSPPQSVLERNITNLSDCGNLKYRQSSSIPVTSTAVRRTNNFTNTNNNINNNNNKSGYNSGFAASPPQSSFCPQDQPVSGIINSPSTKSDDADPIRWRRGPHGRRNDTARDESRSPSNKPAWSGGGGRWRAPSSFPSRFVSGKSPPSPKKALFAVISVFLICIGTCLWHLQSALEEQVKAEEGREITLGGSFTPITMQNRRTAERADVGGAVRSWWGDGGKGLYYTYTDAQTNRIAYRFITRSTTRHGPYRPPKTHLYSVSPDRNHNLHPPSTDGHKENDEGDDQFPPPPYLPRKTHPASRPSPFRQDPLCGVTPGEESVEQPEQQPPNHTPTHNPNCVPMARWQTDSKPTCNTMHEVDMLGSASPHATAENISVERLGKPGWFRYAWKVSRKGPEVGGNEDEEDLVLKNLRLDREFYTEYYDLHRRDAMAMERLTASPHVLDVYSYCGQSALNEIAVDDVEHHAKRMKDDFSKMTYKLYLAASVAHGVADIHEIDYREGNATVVHYDINPRNVAIVEGGRLKLNDFNVAEFLYWDKAKGERCLFKGRLHEPWWRSPEEMVLPRVRTKDSEEEEEEEEEKDDGRPYLDEKVDIYSLGSILYRILTGRSPRGKMLKPRLKTEQERVRKGYPPPLPIVYLDSKYSDHPAVVAIRSAMRHCYRKDPKTRPSAREIANDLTDVLEPLVQQIIEEREEKMKEKVKKEERKDSEKRIEANRGGKRDTGEHQKEEKQEQTNGSTKSDHEQHHSQKLKEEGTTIPISHPHGVENSVAEEKRISNPSRDQTEENSVPNEKKENSKTREKTAAARHSKTQTDKNILPVVPKDKRRLPSKREEEGRDETGNQTPPEHQDNQGDNSPPARTGEKGS